MTDSGDLRKARKLLEDVFEYFASSVYAGPSDLYSRIADFLGQVLDEEQPMTNKISASYTVPVVPVSLSRTIERDLQEVRSVLKTAIHLLRHSKCGGCSDLSTGLGCEECDTRFDFIEKYGRGT